MATPQELRRGFAGPVEARPIARAGQVPQASAPYARLVFLSAPVVGPDGGAAEPVDWAAAAARRRSLAELGFGVAEALEAGERRALGWERIAELVRRTGALGLATGFVAGAAADHLRGAPRVAELVEGVVQQANVIEEAGGVPVLLPLAALSRRRATEDEYVDVYRALLERVSGPVLVDWVGAERRPELAGYFPGRSFERVLALDPAKLRGARLALGDLARESRLRRELLARGQLAFSERSEHLGTLVLGTPSGAARRTELAGRAAELGDFSHVLADDLGARAEELAAALARLEAGDAAGFLARMSAL